MEQINIQERINLLYEEHQRDTGFQRSSLNQFHTEMLKEMQSGSDDYSSDSLISVSSDEGPDFLEMA